VAPSSVPPPTAGLAPSNGTMPNSEPRKVRTLAVKGDQTDSTAPQVAAPAAKPPAAPKAVAPAPTRNPPTSANASANQPLSLAPQDGAPEPPAPIQSQRMASTNPTQIVPSSGASGGYLVQVSSQRSESDAQASYRALQGKFPAVLGSRSPVIKRADLGEKGIYYRAMVGPFGSPEEASQFCGNLKSAGGQCVVQRN